MSSQQTSTSKLPQWVQDHMTAYLLTNGAAGHWYDASANGGPNCVASLLLTTVGRKTGQELQLPLFYGEAPEGLVIVASKGGAPEHPAWYLNLEANPNAKVQVGAEKYNARARTVTGERRAALWALMGKVWPFYDAYQKKTPREIPVVVLERV